MSPQTLIPSPIDSARRVTSIPRVSVSNSPPTPTILRAFQGAFPRASRTAGRTHSSSFHSKRQPAVAMMDLSCALGYLLNSCVTVQFSNILGAVLLSIFFVSEHLNPHSWHLSYHLCCRSGGSAQVSGRAFRGPYDAEKSPRCGPKRKEKCRRSKLVVCARRLA